MRDGMSCGRAEELLSDHHEGSLEEPLLSELSDHLAACEKCRVLRQALGEATTYLTTGPGGGGGTCGTLTATASKE